MARNITHRNALTLLELVVVLVILVAMAGLLVPLLPGMISRAHTSEHGTNCVEIAKQVRDVQRHQSRLPGPTGFLVGHRWNRVSTKLPSGGTGGACGGDLAAASLASLNANTLAALNNVGITSVWDLNDSSTDLLDPTQCYSGTTPRTLASSGSVATLSPTASARLYNDPPTAGGTATGTYVVFGLGTKASMIGKPGGITEPPLHFSDDAASAGDPTKTYGRYALVFLIPGAATANTQAQFIGTLALHPNQVEGADAAVEEFHQQNP